MNEFAGQLQRGVLSSAENTLQSPASQSAADLQGSPEVHLRSPGAAPHAAIVAPTRKLLPVPLLLLLLLVVGKMLPAGTPLLLLLLLLLLLTRSDASMHVLPEGSGTCCFA